MPRNALVIAIGPLLRGQESPRMEETLTLPDPAWLEERELASATTLDIAIDNVGEGLAVTLVHVEGEARETCGRCLTPFVRSFSLARATRLYPFEPVPPDESSEEATPGLDLAHQTLDLYPFLREEVLLTLDGTRNCSSSCRGLCPTCGANLNDGPCGCAAAEAPPASTPLAGLAELWNSHTRGSLLPPHDYASEAQTHRTPNQPSLRDLPQPLRDAPAQQRAPLAVPALRRTEDAAPHLPDLRRLQAREDRRRSRRRHREAVEEGRSFVTPPACRAIAT